MKWFRLYHDMVNNKKVQRLPPATFKAWVNLLCVASMADERGSLPDLEGIAYALRLPRNKALVHVERLLAAKLLTTDGQKFAIWQWVGHQPEPKGATTGSNGNGNSEGKQSDSTSKTYGAGGATDSKPPPKTAPRLDTDKEKKEVGGADAPPPSNLFAWTGRLIRLTQADYDQWQAAYPHVDLPSSLQAADDYYSENPPDGGKWFFPVSRWLKRDNDAVLAEIRKAEEDAVVKRDGRICM